MINYYSRPGGGKINIFVDASLVNCVNVSAAGIYNTTSITISSSSRVLIEYIDGSC